MAPIVREDYETPAIEFATVHSSVKVNVRIYQRLGADPNAQPMCRFLMEDHQRNLSVEAKGVYDPLNEAGMGIGCSASLGINIKRNLWIEAFCYNQ